MKLELKNTNRHRYKHNGNKDINMYIVSDETVLFDHVLSVSRQVQAFSHGVQSVSVLDDAVSESTSVLSDQTISLSTGIALQMLGAIHNCQYYHKSTN